LRQQGKLYNQGGEVIAEGPCELNEDGSHASMWPTLEKGLFERERGVMTLELEGGAALRISERRLRLRINPPHGPRSAIYRMQVEAEPTEEAAPPEEQPEGVPAYLRRADAPAGRGAPPAEQASPPGGLSTAP
jgi:hypothetical protein